MRIGVFGGSFNPPHKSHMSIARKILDECFVDKVVFVPTGDFYEKAGLVSFDKRFRMVELMIRDDSRMSVSSMGNKREFEFTYQVLDELKKKNPDDEVFFVCGMDNLKEFCKWRRFEYILENYKILVIRRNGIDDVPLAEMFGDLTDNIIVADLDIEEISSSTIRSKLTKGEEDFKIYLETEVYEYIKKSGLYGNEEKK